MSNYCLSDFLEGDVPVGVVGRLDDLDPIWPSIVRETFGKGASVSFRSKQLSPVTANCCNSSDGWRTGGALEFVGISLRQILDGNERSRKSCSSWRERQEGVIDGLRGLVLRKRCGKIGHA